MGTTGCGVIAGKLSVGVWYMTILYMGIYISYAVRCRYNNFLQHIHKRHLIARPLGRDMWCLLWAQTLIDDIVPQFLQYCVQYHAILDRVIAAQDCMHNQVSYIYILDKSYIYIDEEQKHRVDVRSFREAIDCHRSMKRKSVPKQR